MNSLSKEALASVLYKETLDEAENTKRYVTNDLVLWLDNLANRRFPRGHSVFVTDSWPALKAHPLPRVSPQKAMIAHIQVVAITPVAGISFVIYRSRGRAETGYGLYIAEQNMLITGDIDQLVGFYLGSPHSQNIGEMRSGIDGLRSLDAGLVKFWRD